MFGSKLLMASYWAETFTRVAADAGFDAAVKAVGAGTVIMGFIMSNSVAGLITMAFLTFNPLIIGSVVLGYFVAFVVFKKNKMRVQDYLERLALGTKEVDSDSVPV